VLVLFAVITAVILVLIYGAIQPSGLVLAVYKRTVNTSGLVGSYVTVDPFVTTTVTTTTTTLPRITGKMRDILRKFEKHEIPLEKEDLATQTSIADDGVTHFPFWIEATRGEIEQNETFERSKYPLFLAEDEGVEEKRPLKWSPSTYPPIEAMSESSVLVDKLMTSRVATSELTTRRVVTSELTTSSVATSELMTNSVATGELSGDRVATSELTTSSVATRELSEDSVATSEMTTSNVGETETSSQMSSEAGQEGTTSKKSMEDELLALLDKMAKKYE